MFSAQINPSPYLAAWIVGLGIVAAATIWFSILPVWFCFLADLGIAVWMYLSLQRHWWVGKRQLTYHQGKWTLIQHNQATPVQLYGEFYTSPYLIVLVLLRDNKRRVNLVILPDNVAHDARRQLRVLLNQVSRQDITT